MDSHVALDGNEACPAVCERVFDPDDGELALGDPVGDRGGVGREGLGGVGDVFAQQDVGAGAVTETVGDGRLERLVRDDARDHAVDDRADEATGHHPGGQGVDRGLDGATRVVSEDDDEGGPQDLNAVLDRTDHGGVNDVPGRTNHEGVAQALVEDDLGGKAGVGAAEDHGEGML